MEDLLRSFQQEQFQHAIDGFSGYYRYWGKAEKEGVHVPHVRGDEAEKEL